MTDIWTTARKQYKAFKLKSWFGIKTRGLNDKNSLALNIILETNKQNNITFVILNNITTHDPSYINDMHKKALRIDENNYVSILFDPSNNWGAFVIGQNIKEKLSVDVLSSIDTTFKKLINDKRFLDATETIIKNINRQIISA